MLDISKFRIIQLTANTELLPFHCEEEDLNNFLYEDAKNYFADFMAVTYLLIDDEKQQIAAYFSLLNDKVAYDPQSKGIWNRINRHIHNNKRRRSYPSVKIGRLAVNNNYTNMGLGSEIVSFIKHLYLQGRGAGCRFITVDALAAATGFYQKNKFEFFTTMDVLDKTRLMYFDLKQLL